MRPGKSSAKRHPSSAAVNLHLLQPSQRFTLDVTMSNGNDNSPYIRMRESPLYILSREQHRGEKMERRPGKTACARRNLFGPVDHKQLQQDFQHILHNGAKGAQQKWNFDFLQDRPVEGLLQWEGLEGRKVPAFYSCVVGEAQRPLQHLYWPVDREDNSHRFPQIPLTEKPKTSMKIGAKRIPEGKKRRQTSLTDYYSAKKQIKMNTQAAAKKPTF